jgi:glyoxylase-like metal-dependent hydrolase (beta-lactamase superfamily II)
MGDTYEVYKIKTGFSLIYNYCYIVLDKATNEALLVDPSWEFNKVVNKLQELDADLKGILLTHSHFDHVNLVDKLIDRYNPQVYMSRAEIDYYGFKCKNLCALNDMDKIYIGSTDVLCLLTPGHTAGGMCFLLSDYMFSGDTVFIEGCGMCNLNGGSPWQMYESIQRIKQIVRPEVKVYPGHSYGKEPGYTLEHIKKENLYFMFTKVDSFVKFRMRGKQRNLYNFK